MDGSIPSLRAPRRSRTAPLCLALLLAAAIVLPVAAAARQVAPTPVGTSATPAAVPTSAPVPAPLPPSAAPPPIDGWLAAETEHLFVRVQPNDAIDAETFVALYAGYADVAYEELVSLFGMDPPGKLTVYAYVDGAPVEAARQSVNPPPLPGVDVIADPAARAIHLYLPSFTAKTPQAADGALRNAVALVLLMIASNGILPLGLAYGLAFYAERPPTPRLARVASIVAQADQRDDDLTNWFELNRLQSIQANPEVAAALGYSVAWFLIERYQIGTFQAFLDATVTEVDWRAAMERAYSRKAEDLQQLWREYLPRWVAGDWRQNLVAAFDLEPSRQLLREARYADAKRLLERSQLLYAALNDRERLSEVQNLLLQCDTGFQAEALMGQAQQALEYHTYDRAESLLGQARTQYDRLPEEHRPSDLLQTYDQLAAQGLTATTSLEEAQRLGRSWGDYPEARAAAVDAGTTFAHLGDEEMVARAETVVADLDARQRRLVLMLSALAALTGAWLALWLWARGKPDLDWK